MMFGRLCISITIRQEQPETSYGEKGHDHDQISDSLCISHEILQRVKSAFHNISSLNELRIMNEAFISVFIISHS